MFAKIPTTKNSDILTSVSANPSLEKKYMSKNVATVTSKK